MAIFYKFKSAKDYNSIPLDSPYISVGNLKFQIFQSKQFGRGKDFDLLVTNAQTNEEYTDESMLIPKNSSVIIRRVPGLPRMPIVTAPEPEQPLVKLEQEVVQTESCGTAGVDYTMISLDDLEMDEFGGDLYDFPEKRPLEASDPVTNASLSNMEEDEKIKALIETSSLEWQSQSANGGGPGQGFGRGMGGGRVMGSHGFERRTPPEGYVCHRCKVPGHFIQHCPTNGDPNYDIKRVRPPTGIPKSQLIATPDGSYVLPGGAVASVKPDEDAFEKEIGSLISKRSTGDLPPELRCPLCREIMKDAVMTSKCCFKSFCDKCIRDFTISKSACVCGATNALADHLVPNMTLRDTINRLSDSDNSSGSYGGSVPQVHGYESRNSQPMAPSSAQSAVYKGAQPGETESKKIEAQGPHKVDNGDNGDNEVKTPNSTSERAQSLEVVISGDTLERASVKETALQGIRTLDAGKEHAKPASGDSAKKKKVKKAPISVNGPEFNWVAPQYFPDANYMMPVAPAAYNTPYWTGPYAGAVPYMDFGYGPLPSPFTGVFPQGQSLGPPCPIPFGLPQRSLGVRSNVGPSLKRNDEIEATKSDLKRKRETDKSSQEQDRAHKQVINSGEEDDGASMKLKNKSSPWPEHLHDYERQRHEKSSPVNHHSKEPTELPRASSKRKSEQDHHDDHHRSNHAASHSNGYHREDSMSTRRSSSSREIDYERSDNDRLSKRGRSSSRYDSPPAPRSRWTAGGERGRDHQRRRGIELEQSVY